MNKLKRFWNKNKDAMHTRTAKVGGYSFLLAIVVLAILIGINIAVSKLPSTWTHYDISAARLYSVTSSTKAVVQNLDRDVTIYWITQDDEEDTTLEKLLDVYGALNSKLTVTKINPDTYPTFAEQYTDETVSNNSLIVVSGDRSRYIPYSDVYEADSSSSYYSGSVAYSFDGEGQITSGINYVVTEDLPKVYRLTGHGESDLPDSFTSALEKQNIEVEDFTLLNTEEIPEDCKAVLEYAPTSDISEEEVTMLQDYLAAGGKLIVFSGPQKEAELTNLESLLDDYNVAPQDGIVIEGDSTMYAFSTPYALLPTLNPDSSITSELASDNSYVIDTIARGYDIGTAPDGVTVTSLLTTSDSAFSKIAGYDLSTYEKEDGDIDGPFSLAFTIEDSNTGAQIVWVGTDNLMDDTVNSYSSGANTDFSMNAVSWTIGQTDAISIRSKSLDYSYLTITTTQANLIKFWTIFAIPAAYLIFGLIDFISRRRSS